MSKDVIFWGCGRIAKEIYCKYKDEITLLYTISNNPKEELFIPEKGKEFEVKRPKNKEKKQNATIIICSAAYEQIAEQLSLLGYLPFLDFVDYEVAEILWTRKSVILLYGFCHIRGIADSLKMINSFCEHYVPVYYPDYLSLNFYQQQRLQFLLSYCEVFIYGVALSEYYYRKNMAVLGRLRSNVKVLRLHPVYFGGYFPQKKRTYNEMNEFAVKSEGYDYTPFSYGDSWMNMCIRNGMKLEDIFEAIEEKEIYDKSFILSNVEGEWKRLYYQEKDSDFKIVEYIKTHYKSHRLFRNETHMENEIIYQYTLQLLHHLGYSEDIVQSDIPLLKCSQHFIYPCVARALELEWDICQEKLDLYTYDGWRKVDVKEYIKIYYQACRGIMKIKDMKILP